MRLLAMGGLVALTLLAGCATRSGQDLAPGEIFDPYEDVNRGVHEFNRGVDRFLFRPASKGYTTIIPDPIEDSFNSFSRNLSEPGDIVNFAIQGRLDMAAVSLARFLMNSTIGFAGLSDPATEFGIPETDTNFGETLHIWGVGEGAYVELPFYGPSTARDAVGTLVDFFTNPISYVLMAPYDDVGIYAEIVERLSDRGRFSDTVDSILYESADSYSQARVIYLQNRRFDLGIEDATAEIDPFELDTQGF